MTTHSLDACLRLVADRDRRRIIHHLRHETTGTTTVDELVDRLHGSGVDSEDRPPQDREALAIQLHHVHLPKLADHDVVEYERESGSVRYRPDEQLETVLDSLPEEKSVPNP